MTQTELEQTHDHAHRNVHEIRQSTACGCFCCCAQFAPSEIREWVDGGETATCPRCGVDSVLGNACLGLTPALLGEMAAHWFTPHDESANE